MLSLSNRIKTFKQWHKKFMFIMPLAENGFYYIEEYDLLCCAYCRVTINHWCYKDNVLKHSPNCPFSKKKNKLIK